MAKFQSLILRLSKISRTGKQVIMMLIDYVLIASILLLMLSIWLGDVFIDLDINNNLILFSLVFPIVGIFIFAKFGLYRVVVKWIGFHALWNVMQAVSMFTLIIVLLVFILDIQSVHVLSVVLGWMLLLMAISALRISAKLIFDDSFSLSFIKNNIRKNVLVYGAGDAGIQLMSVLTHSQKYKPVGFIDDSKDLEGNIIRGINVFSINDIAEIISNHKVNEVLVAMPSISRSTRLSIIEKLDRYPVIVRILPSVSELVEGKIGITDLRKVNIKDLLGRNIAAPNKELLGKNIADKVVLITGAGGSIGSELCRQIVFLKPKVLILYEMNELALYNIEKELFNISVHSIDIYPILGSVNNKNRLSDVFKRFDVDTIYHAAAYKHVPMVEFNNAEGVDNNIFGTFNCAQVAIDAGVETFVLISTDKAVRPTNTMGATKRSAELILQALSAKQSGTKFSIVRFGNVLGSSGSVIPLFTQQIKAGGPVTVTSKEIIRYFMTTPEAVELVIQAGSMGRGGEVFVLDMGKPVLIKDLAEKMIHLSGLEVRDEFHPDGDIEIKYTGLRVGEKLYEELLIGNNVSETDNPLIMRVKEDMIEWDELKPVLDELSDAINSNNQEKLRKLLIQIVPGFQPQSKISDILYSVNS
jgi:FlaA1/EpsC-like NDP-sugar epimerase